MRSSEAVEERDVIALESIQDLNLVQKPREKQHFAKRGVQNPVQSLQMKCDRWQAELSRHTISIQGNRRRIAKTRVTGQSVPYAKPLSNVN